MSVPSNLIPTRITQLPTAPVASEDSILIIVYQGNTYQIRAGDLLSVAGVPVTRQVIAGTGLTGGGQLLNNVTLSVASKGINSSLIADTGVAPGTYGNATNVPVFTVDSTGRVTAATTVPATISGYVPESRQVIAGTGLTGGGALNNNVTLNANLANTTPLSGDGGGSAGASSTIARSDHRHPAVDLSDTNEVDNLLGLANGGTARSLVMNPGAVIWSGADGLYVGPVGGVGQALISGGTAEYTWSDVVTLVNGQSGVVVLTAADVGAPETDGTGATGTWNIDITGNAATATSTGSATNIAGGAANKVVYQTGASATGFVDAPVAGDTFLKWTGSTFTWAALPGAGTVTSVGLSAPTGFAVGNSPVTSSGTLALSFSSGYSLPTTASQANWDTAYSERLQWDGGSTNLVAATGLTSLGGTTVGQSMFTLTNPSAITFPRFNANNTVSALSAPDFRTAIGAGTGDGTVTSVTGTSPVASSGGTTPAISLSANYGDTLNPYGSKTANYFLAAPNGSPGVPTFRAMVAADVPTLNQNTTGQAGSVANSVTFDSSGTGGTSPQTFNGSAAVTISRNTLGAAASGTNSDITSMSGITGGISSPDFVQFDAAVSPLPTDATAKLYYNNDDQFKTLAFQMDANVVQKIGEEQYFRIKCSSAVTKGQVVMFTGTLGASGGLTGAPATGLTADQANYILGIATESGNTNDWIFVTYFGEVKGVDTTGGGESWVQGQVLYYNPSVTGGLTDTKPTTPNAIAVIAAVVHVNSTNGILAVRPTFGSVLGGTDGNVQFGTLNNGDVIVYDSTDQRWENAAQSALAVGTATNVAGGSANQIVYNTAAATTSFITAPTVANTYLEWSGSAFQWSSNPLGTVTSVGLALPSEFTISNSPVTTTGTLTGAWANQTANYVLAGPTTGSATTPTFRALVDGDIPAALTGKSYNGVTPTALSTGWKASGGSTAVEVSFLGGAAYSISGTNSTAITLPGTSGTVALDNQQFYIGTTQVAINRASASLSLTGVSIDGSAGSATNATNIAITDDTSTNATMYPVWVTANTGNLPAKVTSSKLSFNPSTGALTATGGISGGTF